MSVLFTSENIIRLESITSTNTYALELQKTRKVPDGTIIITNEQTAGKGQDKAHWESEAGKNLTISIILYPHFLKAEKQFLLNQSIALGLRDFVVSKIHNQEVHIKWPNDIYIGNKKVAGTLIVNSIVGNAFDYSVIGIGININQETFISDAPNPISFRALSGREYDLNVILEDLCFNLNKRYNQLKDNDISTIQSDYLSSLYQINSWKKYKYKEKEIEAMITGVSEYGSLVLRTKSAEEIECDVREVGFL